METEKGESKEICREEDAGWAMAVKGVKKVLRRE